jgi:hypothetical protein
MKKYILSLLVGLACNQAANASLITDTNFQYSFRDVYSLNALDYVVGENNIQRTSENGNPSNGISYWNPINNDQDANITFQFSFSQPTTSIYLNTYIGAYNFGGTSYGSDSLWASTDGINWENLATPPAPPADYPYNAGTNYASNLPQSLIGSSDIWIQARLFTTGSNIMAQFCRQDTSWATNKIFELNAQTIPEPSTYALFGIGAIGMLMVMRRKKAA